MSLLRALAPVAFAVLLGSCATGPVLRGRIAGLNGVVDNAEKSGAMKCAPRELALAKAQLRELVEFTEGTAFRNAAAILA